MVKVDSKRINVRLKTDVRYALEDLMERWGVKMTPALERAILEAHGGAYLGVGVEDKLYGYPTSVTIERKAKL